MKALHLASLVLQPALQLSLEFSSSSRIPLAHSRLALLLESVVQHQFCKSLLGSLVNSYRAG